MSYVLTNKTAQTPLGFGALGFTLEPGQSATVTAKQFAQVEAHPAMAAWINTGMVSVESDVTDDAEAARLAADEAQRQADEADRLAAEAEAAKPAVPDLPKVPTPTPAKK